MVSCWITSRLAACGLAAVSIALCTAFAADAGSFAADAGSKALAAKAAATDMARLTRISSDPFTDASAEHATEADPSIYSSGATVVAAFDQGLFGDGSGATGVGFATSHDGARTWLHGSLPGFTSHTGGPFSSVVFPASGHGASVVAAPPVLCLASSTSVLAPARARYAEPTSPL